MKKEYETIRENAMKLSQLILDTIIDVSVHMSDNYALTAEIG